MAAKLPTPIPGSAPASDPFGRPAIETDLETLFGEVVAPMLTPYLDDHDALPRMVGRAVAGIADALELGDKTTARMLVERFPHLRWWRTALAARCAEILGDEALLTNTQAAEITGYSPALIAKLQHRGLRVHGRGKYAAVDLLRYWRERGRRDRRPNP